MLLFIFFTWSIILSAFSTVISSNPVYAILSLIFTFFNVSCFLFLFGIEFIPITLIVIYVGAIAVLFLFVVLMLNIKISERINLVYSTLPIAFILLVFFVFETFFFLRFDFTPLIFFNENTTLYFLDFLDFHVSSFSDWVFLSFNIKSVGAALFTKYCFCFVISGYILLVAMISSISLTLQKTFNSKSQTIFNQVLADTNNIVLY